MVEVGSDLWGLLGPTLLLKQSCLELVVHNFPAFLWNFCQCSVTLTVKSAEIQRGPSAFQFVSVASGPATQHHWKETDSFFFVPLLQIFVHISETPPPGWTAPAVLAFIHMRDCLSNSLRKTLYSPFPVRSSDRRQATMCIRISLIILNCVSL